MVDFVSEQAFAAVMLPVSPRLPAAVGAGGRRDRRRLARCARHCELPGSQAEWVIRTHGVFDTDREALGISSRDQTRAISWIHLGM